MKQLENIDRNFAVKAPEGEERAWLDVEQQPFRVYGLMRAGAKSFGALRELLMRENGLRSVRNLGLKSEQEILHSFFNACYAMLRPGEQAMFWQGALDGKQN